jgi:hypothetical protein
MNFLRDNFVSNFFNTSTKTDEDLDKFINKKFTYYLNNSNLLLNFVSDFEDYKTNGRNDNKSKCDECENLYILTSEIFQNYINRVKIPFDITIYSEGKEKSNINYNNKVLYFFDLKDLNKILQSKNLAKNNEDTKILNKKRILCKIISLSFIKIYIIIKSIFQTFNIYNSLIKNKSTIPDSTLSDSQENLLQTQNTELERPLIRPTLGLPINKEENPFAPPINKEENPFAPPINKEENPFAPPINKEENPFAPPENPNEVKSIYENDSLNDLEDKNTQGQGLQLPNSNNFEQPNFEQPNMQPNFEQPNMQPNFEQPNFEQSNMQPNFEQPNFEQPNFEQRNPQFNGGAGIFDFLNPFSKKKDDSLNELQDELPKIKLQTSNNVFYSIFVILLQNTELTSKNFTAEFLTKNVNSITNETLINKLPNLFKYICTNELYLPNFILKNSIIFNDDNFKFLKLKTSDTLENDATYYLKEIDEKNRKNIIDNSKKLKESQGCFTKENVAFIENYCKTNDLDLTDIAIVNSVKSILQKMISNYFKNRNKLYDTIIKKLIKFNSKTNEIENINPSLTYAKIVDLTEQTKNILLDLHIDVFKSLNIIINKIRITLLEKNSKQSSQSLESKQLLESSQSLEPNQSFEPSQPYEPSQSFEPIVKGGKTRKKHYKKQYKKRNKKTKKYTSK